VTSLFTGFRQVYCMTCRRIVSVPNTSAACTNCGEAFAKPAYDSDPGRRPDPRATQQQAATEQHP